MNLKKSVLEALESHRGAYLSGEKLAKTLGVSRQSVSKAAAALKAEGYPLYAVPNRGYMLPAECDILSARQIEESTGARVLLFDSVGSTNRVAAKEYLDGGECIVVSRAQTAGRRKDGGTFPSPCDKGIYLSIALALDIPFSALEKLRRLCGEIVADVIEKSGGRHAERKRTDEIYIEGNKVAGILIECAIVAATGRTESAVIGIGIYTFKDRVKDLFSVFPDDTRNRMISEIYLRIKKALAELSF